MEVAEPAAPAFDRPDSNRPSDLRVGTVDLTVYDIYRPDELATERGILAFLHRGMNALHVSTRHHVVRREFLFRKGDPYEPALLEETARNLRELHYLNNVSVVATDTLDDGNVPVKVQVQDTWSLKTEFAYSLSSDREQRWVVSLSEDNFLGQGLVVGFSIGHDEDFDYHRFFLQKRRVLGTRWWLAASTAQRGSGYDHRVEVARPFYALEDAWGLETTFWDQLQEPRFYLNGASLTGVEDPVVDGVHVLVPQQNTGCQVQGLVRVSPARTGRVWRLGLGVQVRELDFDFQEAGGDLPDGSQPDLERLVGPGSAVAREVGTTVYPHLAVESEGRRWTTTRHVMQYGPVEDLQLSPAFDLRVGYSGPGSGSTSGTGHRVLGDFGFEDWSRLAGGSLLLTGKANFGLGQEPDRHYALDMVAGWVKVNGAGRYRHQTRLFAEAAWGYNLLGTDAFVLGLNRGLRTLGFDGMAGDRLVRWNLEQGVILPGEVLGFFKPGLAIFYDAGLAWWQELPRSWSDLRHEVGVGIRFGSTRSSRGDIARIDLTWPVGEGGGPVLTAVTRGLF